MAMVRKYFKEIINIAGLSDEQVNALIDSAIDKISENEGTISTLSYREDENSYFIIYTKLVSEEELDA